MARKCSDIPDAWFLRAVDAAIKARSRREGRQAIWASRWETAAVLAGYLDAADWVATTDYPDYPQNLIRAKARKLIRQGLLSGCACGCRGDFEVTAGGRLWLMTEPLHDARSH